MIQPDTFLLAHAPQRLVESLGRLHVRPVTAAELIEGRLGDVAREFDHELLAKALAHARALCAEHTHEGPRLHRTPEHSDCDVHAALDQLEKLYVATAAYRAAAGIAEVQP